MSDDRNSTPGNAPTNPAEAPLPPAPEQIPLTDGEVRALDAVRKLLGGHDSVTDRIESAMRRTRVILSVVGELGTTGSGDLSLGQLGLFGLVRRTHELFRAGLHAAADGNSYGWSACLRGILESIGAAARLAESPARVVDMAKAAHVRPGRLIASADRILPGLKDDYELLSKWVHPTAASFYLGMVIADEGSREVVLAVPSPVPSPSGLAAMANPLVSSVELVQRIVGWLVLHHADSILLGKGAAELTMKGGQPLDLREP